MIKSVMEIILMEKSLNYFALLVLTSVFKAIFIVF